MRKLTVSAFLASAVLFLAYCTPKAGKTVAATPVETKEQIVARYPPDQLEKGHTLFTGNCAKCHKLKDPGSRTPAEWDKVLQRMIPKAKLSPDDGALVRAYLIANSKQG
ncbi:c-type cytochrome [Taibaiella koreensis]|uniref:c-type cytochrome n=1 Tax=Taibaiella koreensis TaxID=1268548 RepID=UPI000E59D0A0|nr:c-type cytochrome [Taibaiella koreensis]